MCIICGKPSSIQCNCSIPESSCVDCENDNRCTEIIDSVCVIYHYNTDIPTKLVNLNLPNGTSAEAIFEAIDALIGHQFQTPFTPVDTDTIKWTIGGLYGHSPSANVKISEQSGNTLVENNDGLFVAGDTFKVKIDDNDVPNYLENKLVGGTDDIVSVSTNKKSVGSTNLIEIDPVIDVLSLLRYIRIHYRGEFCNLVNDCVTTPPSGDTLCEAPAITSTDVQKVGSTVTLTVNFTPPAAPPSGGYTIFYRRRGSGSSYTSQAVASSPATVTGLFIDDYEGYIISDCADGTSPHAPFETTSFTVNITSSLVGMQIANVGGVAGFTFDTGTPISPGGRQEGPHVGFTGIINVVVTGTAVFPAYNLNLGKNGITFDCITITGPGTYSFVSISCIASDRLTISGNIGSC